MITPVIKTDGRYFLISTGSFLVLTSVLFSAIT